MQRLGLFESVNDEVGEVIVADINAAGVAALPAEDSKTHGKAHHRGLSAMARGTGPRTAC